MYFWNIDKLKKDLIQKPLSEKEQFKYLLAMAIFVGFGMIPFIEINMWDVYSALVAGITTIIGTYYLYKLNGGPNGKYILQRLLSLGWVMFIRWIVLIMFPVMLLLFFGLEIFSTGVPDETSVYDFVGSNLTYIIYFWLLGKHIKEVSTKCENGQ